MTSDISNQPAFRPVLLTQAAAKKVHTLIEEEGQPDVSLRISVKGGGCSGFQYGFTFDEEVAEDDFGIERDGVAVIIDPMSYQYLEKTF